MPFSFSMRHRILNAWASFSHCSGGFDSPDAMMNIIWLT
jgi:hypothetical protein